jgi:uncharacterized membrane protein YdbT with pleckstrin-like domain
MSDAAAPANPVVWTQHPAVRRHSGGLLAAGLLALAFAAGWWWLPPLAARLSLPEEWSAAVATVARWMPVVLVLPLLQALRAWIISRLVRYELSAERLVIARGLLLRRVDNLELYRVRDLHLELPLTARLFGVGDVVLDTVDHSTPTVVLSGVKRPDEVFARMRDLVEAARRRAGIPGMS